METRVPVQLAYITTCAVLRSGEKFNSGINTFNGHPALIYLRTSRKPWLWISASPLFFGYLQNFYRALVPSKTDFSHSEASRNPNVRNGGYSMRLEKRCIAVGVAALLIFPLAAIADHGGDDGNAGAVVSNSQTGNNDQDGNDQGQSGDEQDRGQQAVSSNPTGGGANNANPQPDRTRVSLAATDAGNAISATGHADLRAQGNEQRLRVEMEANVPDGTMFTLTANGMAIGAITISLGEGEFEFESDNGETLPGGLLPAAITSLALTDSSNNVILQAQFGALSTNNSGLPPVLPIRKKSTLTPTVVGMSVTAEGEADLRSASSETRLKVEVEANVPDGTVWSVFANGTIPLGTATFRLMEAELVLDAAGLAQAGVTDASTIASIQVADARGNQVLTGTF